MKISRTAVNEVGIFEHELISIGDLQRGHDGFSFIHVQRRSWQHPI